MACIEAAKPPGNWIKGEKKEGESIRGRAPVSLSSSACLHDKWNQSSVQEGGVSCVEERETTFLASLMMTVMCIKMRSLTYTFASFPLILDKSTIKCDTHSPESMVNGPRARHAVSIISRQESQVISTSSRLAGTRELFIASSPSHLSWTSNLTSCINQ